MEKLTEKAKRKYIKDNWGHCPYCGSDNIEGERYDGDSNEVWQTINCLACGESWVDVYTLTGIDDKSES